MREHLGEDHGPLEGRAMQALALSTMAVFRVKRVAVELKGNVPAPALPALVNGAEEEQQLH